MKKVKLFFTAMMVLLSSAWAIAQDVTVSGVVKDSSTGEPVPFASIQKRCRPYLFIYRLPEPGD